MKLSLPLPRVAWRRDFRQSARLDNYQWLAQTYGVDNAVTGQPFFDDGPSLLAAVLAGIGGARGPRPRLQAFFDGQHYGLPPEQRSTAYAVTLGVSEVLYIAPWHIGHLELDDRCITASWVEVRRLNGEFSPEEAEGVADAIRRDLSEYCEGAFESWSVAGDVVQVQLDLSEID